MGSTTVMTKQNMPSFSQKFEMAIKELSEKVEIGNKDVIREAAKLYKYLYNEALEKREGPKVSDSGDGAVTEISLD
jgi:hypothetical protein